ncbi:MAG: hypothetical protein A3C08_02935 [Candidatus Taylorbacteria bacterium RIFCSPHIGHO2_02_FULL_47_18]|uniref:Toxin HicA n=1 Tax=Candidatus Taylorbacteria bacterium RIFCSPLOWO2_01_FULL_48_100 TaxID=1802322 RepID=A0A1G2NIE5_9BACT|nr:MAG: hypothetical protein A2670_02210 [Candidatus Taylorbacteria bacterium RIFCSPHIGHO2_01_FULL_48_38]OHA27692.1 MAG: hypothetical protein A3C08_02935 [Candidatus Taylorbacteria bacterium RIFCSPHIGHO2_02_FULL_47_18]OHA35112.1 MAG: hypothetical protein A2938_01705 [Candidatus Taylorbacteria bacterium RIFCSPLOWO2_01_FULL_48_100]OHA41024.1 MAG: hypothetical protein A3J31_02950 [Candidatus Taylorbacteria bacterium RIFCSPLOWO2_02_FULL_48_16]OHA44805.1 MAG: hypothetical protein A3H13_02190 [Candid
MARLPNLKTKKLLAVLKRAGFVPYDQEGSHLYLRHSLTKITTSVPMHSGEINRSLMKLIIKQAGLSENEFRKYL